MNQTTLGFIIKSPPIGSSRGREALDIIFMAATFDYPVDVFFIGEGVYHLIDGDAPGILTIQNPAKNFSTLPLYDVENLFVEAEFFTHRAFAKEALSVPVTLLNQTDLKARLSQCTWKMVL
ncbi:MAG: sulfurtransferase complex subunit TusC [Pseudomonadota bacterium]